MHHDHTPNYVKVWIALLILTVITVSVSYIQFGRWGMHFLNILVAMLVATIKGTLVCLYFMHLKEDNRVNQVVFISAFFFLVVFVGLTLSDVLFR
ncbi:MAG TPA: cytochrome C oxidase subunit IV family protein [Bdellovibrionota bacterium]|nr:cytochrome C oxidase subunit IV family protein [Bdellovibrionota bacterium]